MIMDRVEYKKRWYQENKERLVAEHTAWIKENRDKHRAYVRTCDARNKEKRAAYQRAYKQTEHGKSVIKANRDKHREKVRCRAILNNAIVSGKVTRGICHCGKTAEAHHEDYSKPLEVKWLCIEHHKLLSRRMV